MKYNVDQKCVDQIHAFFNSFLKETTNENTYEPKRKTKTGIKYRWRNNGRNRAGVAVSN